MRVFVACNAYLETGGVELVHQLIKQLSMRNIDTYIVFPQKTYTEKNPIPERYHQYGAKIASEYLDAYDSVYIVPEVFLQELALVDKGLAAVWWMSVDNYARNGLDSLRGKRALHFVQSHYAADFVKNKFETEDCYFLSDYINDGLRTYAEKNRAAAQRENICFYNPQKGLEHIEKLIAMTGDRFRWVPIAGMTAVEVAECLCRGKVYIDFGNHPGKDRIPREAAYCGCCVLTNRKGSAAYQEDVNIPDFYKIGDEERYEDIIRQILYIMENYDTLKNDFVPYIKKIKDEKQVFLQEIDKAVDILQRNIPAKSEKNLERDTVIKFLLMMNCQLDKMKAVNERIIEDIKTDACENAVRTLLEEDRLYGEITTEVWELMRYLAE